VPGTTAPARLDPSGSTPGFAGLLIEHFHDAVLGIDADHRITLVNSSAEQLFGRARSELVGAPLDVLLPDSVRSHHRQWVNEFMAGEVRARFMSGGRTIRLAGVNGRRLALEATIVRTDDFHEDTIAVAVLRDVSEQRSALHSLKQATRVFASTREGVTITDPEKRIISVNQAFTDITGYSEEEVRGQTPAVLSSGRHDHDFYRRMWRSINETGQWQGEIWNRRKSGEVYPEWLTISTVTDERGEVVNYVGVFADVSRVKEAEARVEELSFYDSLTGLPNRRLLKSRLDEAVRRSGSTGTRGALCICNIDRFRALNDSLGHAAGDEVVKMVAERIRAEVDRDHLLAHIRGDEFAVLIEVLPEPATLARLAERITQVAIDRPLRLSDGREVHTTITVGVGVFPDDGADAQALLQAADTAMHRAKDDEPGTCRFYDESQARSARERLELETQLRRAIEHEEFVVHYQPLVSVAQGHILGAEALVRWMHPEHGLVPPDRFIPVAEDTGLIDPIGEWVLETACREFAAWPESVRNRLSLAVNLSPRQFRAEDLVTRLERILAETGLDAGQLSLEITENTLMRYGDQTEATLDRLDALGVNLSIDDFGTGYSSLAYLKRFRADHLKIDRSFIRDLLEENDSRQIVSAIIAMGVGLGMDVIAEGVETEAHRRVLRSLGCTIFQGYLASRPVDANAFRALLAGGGTCCPALEPVS